MKRFEKEKIDYYLYYNQDYFTYNMIDILDFGDGGFTRTQWFRDWYLWDDLEKLHLFNLQIGMIVEVIGIVWVCLLNVTTEWVNMWFRVQLDGGYLNNMKRARKRDIEWFAKFGCEVHWYVTNSSNFIADDFYKVMVHFGF